MKQTIHVIISGAVQGVGYRAFCKRRAVTLGVTGWVKNTSDGSVEAELQGNNDQINTLLNALRQGPPLAHVVSLTQTQVTQFHPYTSFTVLQ